MDTFFKAFEKFIFRDLSFLLGGSVVLATLMYVCRRLPGSDPPIFKAFLAAGVAYTIGYSLQVLFEIVRLVRTKAGYSPSWAGGLLYRLYDRKNAEDVDSAEYERAKLWLYEKAPQRFRDDHERTESLKQIGTAVGPCFALAAVILFAGIQFTKVPSTDMGFAKIAALGLGANPAGVAQGYTASTVSDNHVSSSQK